MSTKPDQRQYGEPPNDPTGVGAPARAPYRPEIDGLRAIAVLAVLLFHVHMGMPGGYVGVDVFFVISGFLITRLISEQERDHSFTLGGFWLRRLRRLFPALAAVLVFTLIGSYVWMLPTDFAQYGKSLVAQSALVSNVMFWRQSGYFEAAVDTKPLLHTWSLAVEEQFYLLFPLIFLFRRRVAWLRPVRIVATIAVVSFVVSVVGSYVRPAATFYLLPTRAWELALGALVCFLGQAGSLSATIRDRAAWVGLAGIGYAVCFYSATTRFPGLSAILPCCGAALVIWGTQEKSSLVGRLLSLRPLVFIGLLSYSLYLWHWPLIVFWQDVQPVPLMPLVDKLRLIVVSFVAAAASYYLVESPVRRGQVFRSTPALVWTSAAMTVAFVGVGALIYGLQGLPRRIPQECLELLAAGNVDRQFIAETSVQELRHDGVALLSGDRGPSNGRPVDVLLWGDSHAMAIAPLVRALATERDMTAAMIAHSQTPPLLDSWRPYTYSLSEADGPEFARQTVAYIGRHSVKHVILAAVWTLYTSEEIEGQATLQGSSGGFRVQLVRTVDAIQAAGAEVWILKDVPDMGIAVPRALTRVCISKGDVTPLLPSLHAHTRHNRVVNAAIDSVRSARVHTLDPTSFFTDSEARLRVEKDSYALFRDREHLTTHGAMLLRPLFDPVFYKKPRRGLSGNPSGGITLQRSHTGDRQISGR